MARGFVQVDNDLFEALTMRWPYSLTAQKAVGWVLRQTLGWKRQWTAAPVSPARIARELGGHGGVPVRRTTVARRLGEMRDLGIVVYDDSRRARVDISRLLFLCNSVLERKRDRVRTETATVPERIRSVAATDSAPAGSANIKTVINTLKEKYSLKDHNRTADKPVPRLRQHEDALRDAVRVAWVASGLQTPRLRDGNDPAQVATWLIVRCIDKIDPVSLIELMVTDRVRDVRNWVGKMTREPLVYELRDRGVRSWDQFDSEVARSLMAGQRVAWR